MSYKLFTDKINKFQCTIQVEGTSLTKSQARIILKSNDISYLFEGSINKDGICDFELPKLKGLMNEGSQGSLKLEVIADDQFFEPFSSDFIVETNKKVTVFIQEQEETRKPNITMSGITLIEKSTEPEVIITEEYKEPEKKESVMTTKTDILALIRNKK